MTGQGNPLDFAKASVEQLGGVDQNTAITDLNIAKLLVSHREAAINDFSRDLLTDSGSNIGQV